MDSSGKFSYSFRRYPLLRAFIGVFVILIVLGSVFLFNYRTKPVPVIHSIIPPVGSPGDLVVINGENFGAVRDIDDGAHRAVFLFKHIGKIAFAAVYRGTVFDHNIAGFGIV